MMKQLWEASATFSSGSWFTQSLRYLFVPSWTPDRSKELKSLLPSTASSQGTAAWEDIPVGPEIYLYISKYRYTPSPCSFLAWWTLPMGYLKKAFSLSGRTRPFCKPYNQADSQPDKQAPFSLPWSHLQTLQVITSDREVCASPLRSRGKKGGFLKRNMFPKGHLFSLSVSASSLLLSMWKSEAMKEAFSLVKHEVFRNCIIW